MASTPYERASLRDCRPKGGLSVLQMKKVAWGYVPRNIGNRKELLIATRCKKGDELREGQLVLPGGGLEGDEIATGNYIARAITEVYQETGVTTELNESAGFLLIPRTFIKPNLCGKLDTNGFVYLRYKDSGLEYQGRIITLKPVDPYQVPFEQQESDARDPRYILFSVALQNQEKFTPACQVLLDIIKKVHE